MVMLVTSRRYRTGTAELAPFWRALALHRHDPYDVELLAAEWDGLCLTPETRRALDEAGFSCYRAVPPCPDWLLRTLPGLGEARLRVLRRVLPYDRDIYASPPCPGRVLEDCRIATAGAPPAPPIALGEWVTRALGATSTPGPRPGRRATIKAGR
jgi:hypothetical protein